MSVGLPKTEQQWFAQLEPRPQARINLFCFPHAGSGAAAYRPWLTAMPPEIEMRILQLPGREARLREQPFTRMDALLEVLSPAIELHLNRPYILFGHSMGALIAFELARALRQRGVPAPLALVVSGRRAPQLPDPEPPLHPLADGAFVGAMVRRYNGIPRVILEDIDLLRLFLPTLRADLELIETCQYRDEAPLAYPIIAMGGETDGRATVSDLSAWQVQTNHPLSVHQFPGGHFYLQAERDALIAAMLAGVQPLMEQR
jgi:medium-chain acyl-[acyl-carrier-protein] hydrolase